MMFKKEEHKFVMVCGMRRTGTTLTERIFNLHSQFYLHFNGKYFMKFGDGKINHFDQIVSTIKGEGFRPSKKKALHYEYVNDKNRGLFENGINNIVTKYGANFGEVHYKKFINAQFKVYFVCCLRDPIEQFISELTYFVPTNLKRFRSNKDRYMEKQYLRMAKMSIDSIEEIKHSETITLRPFNLYRGDHLDSYTALLKSMGINMERRQKDFINKNIVVEKSRVRLSVDRDEIIHYLKGHEGFMEYRRRYFKMFGEHIEKAV